MHFPYSRRYSRNTYASRTVQKAGSAKKWRRNGACTMWLSTPHHMHEAGVKSHAESSEEKQEKRKDSKSLDTGGQINAMLSLKSKIIRGYNAKTK